jgi:hypothetical protein
MYHSPGLRDGVFFRAWSVPPYLPAIHNYKIASVPFSGLGINWGGWESIRRSRQMPPSERESRRNCADRFWAASLGSQYPFTALSV